MRIAFVGDSLTEGVLGSSYFAILREKLPDDTLINLGKGNDTVVSLYRRIARLHFDEPFDIAFLWVGVNDVGERTSWLFRVINALLRQPRSRSLDEFRAYYQATLDLLCRDAKRVIAVPPLLRGEDIGNEWNRQFETLASVIKDLTSCRERAEYLDLRATFAQELTTKRISDYLPKSAIRVALDALTLRGRERIDGKAAERGLHFTLDGVHLNSAGAEIVAKMLLKAIVG